MLQDLWLNSELRAIALEKYKNEFEHKSPRFIEIFSKAGRIKRNTDLRSLSDALDRCKLTIKVLQQQIAAVEGRIKSNNVLIDEIAISSNLVSDFNKREIRKKIYKEKLKWFKRVSDALDWKFSKLNELELLLKENYSSKKEREIINLIAITEVELDKYVIKNKEEIVESCKEEILLLEIETLRKEKREQLDRCNVTYIKCKLSGDAISEEERKSLYEAMFDISTNNINYEEEFELFLEVLDNYEDVTSYYIGQVIERISKINRCESNVLIYYKEQGKFKELKKLLDKYFKGKDGKYDYEHILRDKSLFPFLLAFDGFPVFEAFFKDSVISSESIGLKSSNRLVWSEFIPRETLYYLYELNGKKEPAFYDVYKLIQEKEKLRLPEGIVELRLNSGVKSLSDHPSEQFRYLFADNMFDGFEIDESPYVRGYSDPQVILPLIIADMHKKIAMYAYISFPKSLRSVSGDLFLNCNLTRVELNDGLEYIGAGVFKEFKGYDSGKVPIIRIPTSVSRIDRNAFDLSFIKFMFSDYKNSKFLQNLLYNPRIEYLEILKELVTSPWLKCGRLGKMIQYYGNDLFISGGNTYYLGFLRNAKDFRKIQSLLANIVENGAKVDDKEDQDEKAKTIGGL